MLLAKLIFLRDLQRPGKLSALVVKVAVTIDEVYWANRRHIDMLNAFLCLDLGVDTSSCGSYEVRLAMRAAKGGKNGDLPAAAAGSDGLLTPSATGLNVLFDAKGLLLRRLSGCILDGERERRSNLEARFGSGSVWSKRDRLVDRRSSSAMLTCVDLIGRVY